MICEYILTDKEIIPPEDDRENYFWCNIEDILAEDKRIEKSGKIPKTLNAKMRHFTFLERYYKRIKLMKDNDRGVFIKVEETEETQKETGPLTYRSEDGEQSISSEYLTQDGLAVYREDGA